MDPKILRALSELQAGAGGDRGIQWKVHVQPVRPARRLLHYLPFTYAVHLPQLLSCQCPMAIHGYPTCKGGVISTSISRAHLSSMTSNRSATLFATRCCRGCKTRAKNCPVSTFMMIPDRAYSSKSVHWTSTTPHGPSSALCGSAWPRWPPCLGRTAYSSSMAAAAVRRPVHFWMPCKTQLATCLSTLRKSSYCAQ